MEIKHFKMNDTIFHQGDIECCMYEIISGSVDIVSSYQGANEKVLTTLREGGSFGELAVIDHMPRSATAIAATDVDVRVIDETEFKEYILSDSDRVNKIFAGISDRIRELSKEYDQVCEDITQYYHANNDNAPNGLKERLTAFFGFVNSVLASDANTMANFYADINRYY